MRTNCRRFTKPCFVMLGFLGLLAGPSPASAQLLLADLTLSDRAAVEASNPDSPTPVYGAETSISTGYRSKRTAWLLTAAATLVPIVIAMSESDNAASASGVAGITAAYVGPSVGNFYAYDWKRGLGGLGLRLAGTAIALPAFEEDGNNDDDWLLLAGAAVFVAGTVWNVLTVPTSVDRYNGRRAQNLELAPLLDPSGGGGITARFTL